MERPPFPVFDAHLHLDPEGAGVGAAREFQRAGGSGLLLVGKPYRSVPCSTSDDFERSFEVTLGLAEDVRRETGLTVLAAVGPHPAELSRLAGGLGLAGAREVMLSALERAGRLVRERRADALGEIGRPHYAVPDEVWRASNEILSAGMALAGELDCAAVLHTESATPAVFRELSEMAGRAGLPLDRAVKHFSPPAVRPEENFGLFPSVLAGKGNLEKALAGGTRFLLETDYIDDPRRPGAVLGPATVPKRTLELFRRGGLTEEQAFTIHRDNPERVFGKGAGTRR